MNSSEATADAMRAHIERLLAQHEIRHYWIKGTAAADAYALRDSVFGDRIGIPRVRGELTYALALHEIGHILGAHQNSPDVMTREREAWRWARDNAIKWTPKMEHYAARLLLSYERWEQEARTREAELRAQLAASPAVGSSPCPDDDLADQRYNEERMREIASLWEEGE